MEITSENFEAQFKLIKESIMNAEFIALDTEFSGKQLLYHILNFTDQTDYIYI